MLALEKISTQKLVDLPQNKVLVDCKWVYTVKLKHDGTRDQYKTHLVAKGYTQTYGIDYQDTFVPTAKLNSTRVLLSMATNQGWHPLQFDAKMLFGMVFQLKKFI